jgi:hypothetical protein
MKRFFSLIVASATLVTSTATLQAQFYALPYGTGGTYNMYRIVTTDADWNSANAAANGQTVNGVAGNLARIDNAAENIAIARAISATTYIGANDISVEGAWRWATPTSINGSQFWSGAAAGSPVGGLYSNWNGGEPNNSGGEHVAEINTAGGWNDIGAGNARDYAIEWQLNSTVKPTAAAANAKLDPLTGKYYERITTNLTWDQARVVAESHSIYGVSGHLATISDASENYLVQQLGGTSDRWIGFHDSDATSQIDGRNLGGTEGTFRWVTGEPVTYTNWNASEPNNSGGEDAGVMNSGGGWNDHQAGPSLGQGGQTYNSIVEYNTPANSQNQFFVPLTYLERRAVASFGDGNGEINSLAEAKALLNLADGDAQIASQVKSDVYGVSFVDPGNSGSFQNSFAVRPFLGDTPGDSQDFAVRASGFIEIPAAGPYTFAIVHDDHIELTIDGITQTSPGCCGNPTMLTYNLDEGLAELDLFFYERGGGAALQLFAAAGSNVPWDPNTFRLVGDSFNGGLALQQLPEPTSIAVWSLFGTAALGFAAWRYRRKK